MRFLYRQYRGGQLYVYPEHRDHDPGHNGQGGYGDLFPTNSPCVVISQGSSGSDRAFVRAFFQYDEEGGLAGWTRYEGGSVSEHRVTRPR